jgi:hypothetical protein
LLKNPSVSEAIELEEKRRRLQVQLDKYEEQCAAFANFRAEDFELQSPEVAQIDHMDDCEAMGDGDASKDADMHPENIVLFLPSNVSATDRRRNGLENMAHFEARLRSGQINDALQRLRIALGGKSLIYREKVKRSCMPPNYLKNAPRCETAKAKRRRCSHAAKSTKWNLAYSKRSRIISEPKLLLTDFKPLIRNLRISQRKI